MAYEPTEWEAGMKVTASRLNKLEQGVANAGGIVRVTVHLDNDDNWVLDSTWQEIYDLIQNGSFVYIYNTTNTDELDCLAVASVSYVNGVYYMTAVSYLPGSPISFTTNSANGYPTNSD